MTPDWKPPKRVRDVSQMRIAKLREPVCVVCMKRPTESAHHGVKAGQGGDDVPANLFGVCGDGTRLCHGLLERRDLAALRALGEHVLANRPDFIEYLHAKLSSPARSAPLAAAAWLKRNLLVESG